MQLTRLVLNAALILASLLWCNISYGQPHQQRVNKAYARAILKVEVSAPAAIFPSSGENKGENICKSEGTAFLVGDTLAVTASHVYALDPKCGPPSILLYSEAYKVQMLAEAVLIAEDITLLQINDKLPPEMCSLTMSDEEVEGVDGVRFGIPKGMRYPSQMPITINPKDGDFNPFVKLTPTPAEQGESGGPIVYVFDVVGVLRAKHAKYPAFSVMTPIAGLISAINSKQLPLTLGGNVCNAELGRRTVVHGDPVNVVEQVTVSADFAKSIADIPSDCPTCISVTKTASNTETTTIEVRSHSLPPTPTVAEVQAAGAIIGWTFPLPKIFTPREGTVSEIVIAENLRNQNFTKVREVSERIAADSRSQMWESYIREMKGEVSPAPPPERELRQGTGTLGEDVQHRP